MRAFALSDTEYRQLERLARRHNITIREIMAEMGEVIRREFNAEHNQNASGPLFTFVRNHVVGPDYFVSANVPGPEAVVDIFEARAVWTADVKFASVLLDIYHSRDLAKDVLANTLAWSRFWAVRFPTSEGRVKFKAVLEELEEKPRLRVIDGGA
ncbi:hypothetical protein [Bradyrhizobium sp. NBAIM01]|uniref:hypothetical protein n=1 Tax=Bradyrhizobium sp. NBAIM01 TaxID=2793818 RepID=UPI001CD694CC|nr:hypothetical protein [Bradyrhizobium sp. NBAIM01]MCA1513639.1 hypothetical protein [Bradyrhizobium sp. NBAIM01]